MEKIKALKLWENLNSINLGNKCCLWFTLWSPVPSFYCMVVFHTTIQFRFNCKLQLPSQLKCAADYSLKWEWGLFWEALKSLKKPLTLTQGSLQIACSCVCIELNFSSFISRVLKPSQGQNAPAAGQLNRQGWVLNLNKLHKSESQRT